MNHCPATQVQGIASFNRYRSMSPALNAAGHTLYDTTIELQPCQRRKGGYRWRAIGKPNCRRMLEGLKRNCLKRTTDELGVCCSDVYHRMLFGRSDFGRPRPPEKVHVLEAHVIDGNLQTVGWNDD